MTDAEIIAANTTEAYMFNEYGLPTWIKCAQHLIDLGLDQEGIEAFLLSKHMRWCSDNAEDSENVTYEEFVQYVATRQNFRGTLEEEVNRLR